MKTCPECDGDGGTLVTCCTGSIWNIECGCGGQKVIDKECETCNGEGEVDDDQEEVE